jgi:hypothetical protein
MPNQKKAQHPKRFPRHAAKWIKGLNFLLRFADERQMDLSTLNNGAFEEFLDRLHFEMHGSKRDRNDSESLFNRLATRDSVRRAQLGLWKWTTQGSETIPLAPQTMTIYHDPDFGFYCDYRSDDFPTNVYQKFAQLLAISEVKLADFRDCANTPEHEKLVGLVAFKLLIHSPAADTALIERFEQIRFPLKTRISDD